VRLSKLDGSAGDPPAIKGPQSGKTANARRWPRIVKTSDLRLTRSHKEKKQNHGLQNHWEES
jgi:hypothetical protein